MRFFPPPTAKSGTFSHLSQIAVAFAGADDFSAVPLAEDWRAWAALALLILLGLGLAYRLKKQRDQLRRAEEALREDKARLRRMFESAPMALYRCSPDGRILDLNARAVQLLGCESSEEALTLNIRDLWLDPDECAARTRSASQNAEADFEFLLQRRDGSAIWARDRCRAIFDGRGSLLYLEGSLEDITESKIKDEEIKAHQAELERLLRDSRDSRAALQNALGELGARLAEMEAVNRVSSALRAAQTLDEMLPILLHETLAALQSENGAIYLAQPETGELRIAAARGFFNNAAALAFAPGAGLTGSVFLSGKPHISREYVSDPLLSPSLSARVARGWGGACVPIRAAEEVIGVFHVSVPLPREITPEQIKLLVALADIAGTALHRLRLHEATRQQVRYLQALRIMDRTISSSFDSRVTMSVLLDQIFHQLQADAAGVLLLKPRGVLECAADRGFRAETYRQAQLTIGEDLAGIAAKEMKPVQFLDLQNEPRFKRSALAEQEGFCAGFAVPLIAKGEVKGALEVFFRKPFTPAREWLEFLEALAGQAVIAFDNFQLFEGLQRANAELRRAYDATLEGWSRALDLRDRETEGHARRVTDLTVKLARKMGVPESEIVHVRRGALLHDIGKMGIPDSILNKPGQLSPEEWEVIRRHPVYAYEFLYPIEYLRPALDIPYYHHEKWDGSGYPRGLRGEEIPLAARVFALADVWDALTNDRPYRKRWEREQALEYVREQAGKHFDPQVVAAFLELMNQT